MKISVYNLKNEEVSTIDLPENIFNERWRSDLIAQVLRAQLANKRKPWAHAKDRSEVSGGGIKPWQQKGTGRARHGSTRWPIWRHGGVTFGPRNTTDFTQKVNKKMRALALETSLAQKLSSDQLK